MQCIIPRVTVATMKADFAGYFRELVATSRKDLHAMFLRTYGVFYQQNAHVFAKLYDDLSQYYLTGEP